MDRLRLRQRTTIGVPASPVSLLGSPPRVIGEGWRVETNEEAAPIPTVLLQRSEPMSGRGAFLPWDEGGGHVLVLRLDSHKSTPEQNKARRYTDP